MFSKSTPFDTADYLDDEDNVEEFLSAALEDPNPDVFLAAIRAVARAISRSDLTKASGLGRKSLYRAMKPGAKPRYETISRLLHALGFKFTIERSLTRSSRKHPA